MYVMNKPDVAVEILVLISVLGLKFYRTENVNIYWFSNCTPQLADVWAFS
jgi:hypothetical protein